MYFQLVDNQVLSTQGQPDVFNLHRLTAYLAGSSAREAGTRGVEVYVGSVERGVQRDKVN